MKIKDLIKRPAKSAQPVKQLKATARRAAIPVEESYDDDEPNVRLSRAFLVVMLLHVVAVGGIFAFSSLKKNDASVLPEETKTPAATVAATTAKVPTQDMPADSRVYVVGAGETLGQIASAFGLTRNDLIAANHLAASATLKEGDKLVIPAKSTAEAVPLDVKKLLKLSDKTPVTDTPKTMARVTSTNPATSTTSAAAKPVPVKTVAKATDTTAALASGKTYVVQKGDNPVAIARLLKVKYADLLKVNNITDPRKLQIGQKLIIPE